MRFRPWMLAPPRAARSKGKAASMPAGPWGCLPSPVLAALTSSDQSPMVRSYLLNGGWSAPIGTGQELVTPETLPAPTQDAESSSLSLTIRVVQPTLEETLPVGESSRESTVRRVLQAFKRKLRSSRTMGKLIKNQASAKAAGVVKSDDA